MQTQQIKPGFTERLKQIIGEQAPYKWARSIGIGKSTFNGIFNKKAQPQLRTLLKIAWNTNASLSWLLTGRGASRLVESPDELENRPIFTCHDKKPLNNPAASSMASYILVPLHGDDLKCDHGGLGETERSVDRMAFKIDWITKEMELDPKELVMVTVQGDSMIPTLHQGDMLLLDTREGRVCNDGIYVIRQERDLLARRLQRGFDGSIKIKSDNHAYDTLTIPEDQLQRLDIIGRVVWIGHRL